jgi:alanine-glyoxylate transaminase/serine-glyoxylate transaminase/serine-pyruvate transaminase
VPSWYFDLTYIMQYWGSERTYHHTAPISMVYALREALRVVDEEGLEARWERHRKNQAALVAGLEAMGLEMLSAPEHRMVTVCAVRVPAGIEDKLVRGRLMEEFNIEIAGGLGELKGRIWRIGLMGASCTEGNVLLLLGALEKILGEEGFKLSPGAGVAAAAQAYQEIPAPAAT